MKIEFTEEQLALLTDVLAEYTEASYQEMFEYKRVALEAEEAIIKKEYSAYAEEEEKRFSEVKALGEYIEKYKELFGA